MSSGQQRLMLLRISTTVRRPRPLPSLERVRRSCCLSAASGASHHHPSGVDADFVLSQRQQRRLLGSSSAFPDLPILDSVRDSIKSSLLDHAANENSRLWVNRNNSSRNHQHPPSSPNGFVHTHHHEGQHQHSGQPHHKNSVNGCSNHHRPSGHDGGDLNRAIGTHLDDPLDDLYLPQHQQQQTPLKSTLTTAALQQQQQLLLLRYWPHLPPQVIATAEADPIRLSKLEIDQLSASIRQDLIGTDHPILNSAASYFFEAADGGKRVRPILVLLLSRALSDHHHYHDQQPDQPLQSSSSSSSSSNNNNNNNNNHMLLTTTPFAWQRPDLADAQRRLAEISELIHTASLFHDDVIDGSDTRRSIPAVHKVFGNKLAILAGDYLLARACICLARLRNVEVVETMATIIEHLVRGEVMQLRGSGKNSSSSNEPSHGEEQQQQESESDNHDHPDDQDQHQDDDRLIYYLRKNYFKTGSLMANSCKSAALLGSYHADLVDASYRFGKHVGMAFQLVDDVLDFEGSLRQLGKPALADIKAGLATAPVLFAAQQFPELNAMMDRKFKQAGDVDRAVELVFGSNGMERTKDLARWHAELAMDAILQLHPSVHRDALVQLAYKVVAQTK